MHLEPRTLLVSDMASDEQVWRRKGSTHGAGPSICAMSNLLLAKGDMDLVTPENSFFIQKDWEDFRKQPRDEESRKLSKCDSVGELLGMAFGRRLVLRGLRSVAPWSDVWDIYRSLLLSTVPIHTEVAFLESSRGDKVHGEARKDEVEATNGASGSSAADGGRSSLVRLPNYGGRLLSEYVFTILYLTP